MLVLALLAVLANTDPKGVSIERCQEDDSTAFGLRPMGRVPYPLEHGP